MFQSNLFVIAFVMLSKIAFAQTSNDCVSRNKAGLAAVVICPAGLDRTELREAGIDACDGATICNAWIWDDENKAPSTPPTFSNPMTDDQISSAIAVWMSKPRELNICSEVGC